MSFDDALEVAPPKSPASTSATARPARAAWAATARADDPAADDEQVEAALGELVERLRSTRAHRTERTPDWIARRCPPRHLPSPSARPSCTRSGTSSSRGRRTSRRRRRSRSSSASSRSPRSRRSPGRRSAEVWPFLVVTSLLQLTYFVLLTTAYGRAELSFVYPIARGSAPVLVLLGGVVVLGEAASAAQVGGVLLVAGGVLLVRGIRGPAAFGDLALALAIGVCIAAYTLLDQRGVEYASPVVYQELSMIPVAIAFLAYVLGATRHGRPCGPRSGSRAAAAGLATFGAYILVLAALSRAPGRSGRGSARDERRHRDGARGAAAARARRGCADGRRGRRRPRGRAPQPLVEARHRDRATGAVRDAAAPRAQPPRRRRVRRPARATGTPVLAFVSTCRSMYSPVASVSSLRGSVSTWNRCSRLLVGSEDLRARPRADRTRPPRGGSGCDPRPCTRCGRRRGTRRRARRGAETRPSRTRRPRRSAPRSCARCSRPTPGRPWSRTAPAAGSGRARQRDPSLPRRDAPRVRAAPRPRRISARGAPAGWRRGCRRDGARARGRRARRPAHRTARRSCRSARS